MDTLSNAGMLLGGSWASGINLYLTMAVLGIADRLGIINLPGSLDILSNPIVIAVALLLYFIEFFADKIPYVDSAWDTFHTIIRPAGATIMAAAATTDLGPGAQFSIAMVCGAVALDAHLTKATARVAVNTSPEPITNSVASVSEDALVLVAMWLIMRHPVIAGILAISFIVFSVWFLKVMFRFLKKVFVFLAGGKSGPGNGPEGTEDIHGDDAASGGEETRPE